MFKRIEQAGRQTLRLRVEEREVLALEGDSVATALLAAGVAVFRLTPVSGAPRGPLCLMGTCFECLVEVDGRHNVQACMTPARQGQVVRLQRGARSAGLQAQTLTQAQTREQPPTQAQGLP